ncbi:hypothetical protein ACQ4PT_038608 [Festuca glaucescens]
MASKVDLRRAKDAKGNTVLHGAPFRGCLESCRFLVEECGIDVNAVSKTGGTPMSYAAKEGNVQVMRYFLHRGGYPAMPDERGSTPLHRAALGDAIKCTCLDDAGADVNALGSSAPTPLVHAVHGGLTDSIKFLLEAGADSNIPDQAASSVEETIAYCKSQGKEAFAKEDYLTAISLYDQVIDINPLDASMYANRSLCWLRMRHGSPALDNARKCRMMRPRWSKAWYREGTTLSFMKDYEGAADAFRQALQLDPKSEEIREALRKAENAVEEPLRV